MSQQQPIIRVKTEAVKAAIEQFVKEHSEHFTTADIARFMGVEEYPVRAAVSWLTRYGVIEIIPGVRSKRYMPTQAVRTRHCDNYSVSVCRVKEQAGEVDFSALNRAFGFA